jgi:hypothetical protein
VKSKRQPRVAVLYSVPLLCEALLAVLDDIAEVQTFPAGRGDTLGLLRCVRPDAVVVDDVAEAEAARPWTKRHERPLVHVALRDQKVRVLQDGAWVESPGASAEAIRNVLAGSIYGPSEDGS